MLRLFLRNILNYVWLLIVLSTLSSSFAFGGLSEVIKISYFPESKFSFTLAKLVSISSLPTTVLVR